MKNKMSLFGFLSLIVLLISSCQKDDSAPAPINAKLKQVLLYSTLDSKEPISIVEEYEYDDAGRINKVSSPMYNNGTIVGTIKYDIYEYNSSGQLAKLSNYNANLNSPTGFINLKNTSYIYSAEGKKIKETISFGSGGVISEYSDFEYENGLLATVKKYTGNELEDFTKYEYDNSGQLIKEIFYASDDHCISYTIHSYTGSLQTRSDIYSGQSNSLYRTINRTYDKNNNIIALESKEQSLVSSTMSHVLRYKYYEQ